MVAILSGFVFLYIVGTACSLVEPTAALSRYDFALNLEFDQQNASNFTFFYTYDDSIKTLKMAVKIFSLGWVGIGLSRDQFMPGSDIAIAWVDDSGKGHLQVSII